AMTPNGITRLRQCRPNSGRRIDSMIAASATVPETDLTSTSAVGLMSRTPTLMKRKETPQISASAMNATYGMTGVFDSDTRHPIVGREHKGDRSVVFDAHAHVCSRAACLDFYSAFANAL